MHKHLIVVFFLMAVCSGCKPAPECVKPPLLISYDMDSMPKKTGGKKELVVKETIQVPFTSLKYEAKLLFNTTSLSSSLLFPSGDQIIFRSAGIPLFFDQNKTLKISIFKAIPHNQLSAVYLSPGNDDAVYLPVERSGVDFVLFRAGLLTETGFYLVVYDNATRKNYLRVYEIANQRLGSFQEYPLPSFSPPAGSTYEMEPPVFLLPEKDSVRVVAGDLNALLSHKQLKICRIPDCSEVLEAIATPNGCVILGKLRKKNLNSAFFIESFPGRRTIVPYHAGVP